MVCDSFLQFSFFVFLLFRSVKFRVKCQRSGLKLAADHKEAVLHNVVCVRVLVVVHIEDLTHI